MNQDYIQPDNWSIIEDLIAKALNHLKAYLVLEMVPWDNALTLRKATAAKHFKEAILLVFTIPIRQSRLVEKWISRIFRKGFECLTGLDRH
jgi:hypothetical protein